MPTRFQDDSTPIVQFDPRLEVSPFSLFRRLRSGGGPLLIDVRRRAVGWTLKGALPFPGDAWQPPADRDVVLFDDDGSEALPLAEELQRRGHERVKILFGGLELYRFALDPAVVGDETYLERLPVQR